MLCKAFDSGTLKRYKSVVILSQYRGKILLSRHRERDTWETQGGHIEPGESCEQAARRELFEESGARRYALRLLCDYRAWDEHTGEGANGQVFAARIEELGPLPESEMAEVRCFDALPEGLTYPAITPVLFERLRETVVQRSITSSGDGKILPPLIRGGAAAGGGGVIPSCRQEGKPLSQLR